MPSLGETNHMVSLKKSSVSKQSYISMKNVGPLCFVRLVTASNFGCHQSRRGQNKKVKTLIELSPRKIYGQFQNDMSYYLMGKTGHSHESSFSWIQSCSVNKQSHGGSKLYSRSTMELIRSESEIPIQFFSGAMPNRPLISLTLILFYLKKHYEYYGAKLFTNQIQKFKDIVV